MRLSSIVMVAALVMVSAGRLFAQDVKPAANPVPAAKTSEAKPAITAPNPAPAVKAKSVVPTIGELNGLKLDKIVLGIENLSMKLQQGQTELEKMKTDAQSFVQSLQKPGYQLAKDQQGKWIYQAEPAKTPEKK